MTKTRKRPGVGPQTAFWDTSAIVPLCCFQPRTAQARQTARIYARQVVWWGTAIESISSLNRLVREGFLTAKESVQAFARLVGSTLLTIALLAFYPASIAVPSALLAVEALLLAWLVALLRRADVDG